MSNVGSPCNFHLNRCTGKERDKKQQNGFVVAEGFSLRNPGGRNEETKSVSCAHHTPISRVGRSNKSYDLPNRCFCFHIYKHILFLYIYIIIDGNLEVTHVPRTVRRTHNIFIGIPLFFFFNGKIACVRKCVCRFLRIPTYLPAYIACRGSPRKRDCLYTVIYRIFIICILKYFYAMYWPDGKYKNIHVHIFYFNPQEYYVRLRVTCYDTW